MIKENENKNYELSNACIAKQFKFKSRNNNSTGFVYKKWYNGFKGDETNIISNNNDNNVQNSIYVNNDKEDKVETITKESFINTKTGHLDTPINIDNTPNKKDDELINKRRNFPQMWAKTSNTYKSNKVSIHQ
jgi:hypothetical protein